jgi:RNA polymerase sigma-70 factor, ECF subfamily
MITLDGDLLGLAPLSAASEAEPGQLRSAPLASTTTGVTSAEARSGTPASTAAEGPSQAATSSPSSRPFGELPEAWFRAHFSRLWRLVARLGVAPLGVDDVVQEAFIAAARRRTDIAEGREWAFLVGSALRLSWNHRHRAAARREVAVGEGLELEASPLPDAEQLLIEKRARLELEQALSALSDAHRAVFVLYELEGFSAPEIAELLELPLGTVASRLGRARAQFSKQAARLQRGRARREEDT